MTATTTAVSDATGMESVDSFRLRAREWIPANLRRLADLPADDRCAKERVERRERLAAGPCAAAHAVRRRLRRHLLPEGVRRARPHRRAPARLQRGGRRLRDADAAATCRRSRICGPTLLDFGTEEQKREHLPPRSGGERDLGAVPVRAERRLRPRRCADPRRPRRRRVRPQRLEDLELGRLRRRLRAVPGPHQLGRAQAPRPHDVHREDPPARRARSSGSSRSTAARSSARSSSTTSSSRPPRGRRGRRRLDGRLAPAVPRAQRRRRRLDRTSAARGPKGGAARRPMRSSTWSAAPAGRTTPTRGSWSPRRTPSASSTGTSSTGSPRACAPEDASHRRLAHPALPRRERHPPAPRSPSSSPARPPRCPPPTGPTPARWACHFLFRQATQLGGGSTEIHATSSANGSSDMPREYAADRDVPFSQVRHGR